MAHVCNICGNLFTRKRNLKRHINEQHNEQNLKYWNCPKEECTGTFIRRSNLTCHLEKFHKFSKTDARKWAIKARQMPKVHRYQQYSDISDDDSVLDIVTELDKLTEKTEFGESLHDFLLDEVYEVSVDDVHDVVLMNNKPSNSDEEIINEEEICEDEHVASTQTDPDNIIHENSDNIQSNDELDVNAVKSCSGESDTPMIRESSDPETSLVNDDETHDDVATDQDSSSLHVEEESQDFIEDKAETEAEERSDLVATSIYAVSEEDEEISYCTETSDVGKYKSDVSDMFSECQSETEYYNYSSENVDLDDDFEVTSDISNFCESSVDENDADHNNDIIVISDDDNDEDCMEIERSRVKSVYQVHTVTVTKKINYLDGELVDVYTTVDQDFFEFNK